MLGVTVLQTSKQKFPTQRHGDSLDYFSFLVNKTYRRTEFQFYWYYDSTFSGNLSAHHQEFLAYVGIGTFYADLMTVCCQE